MIQANAQLVELDLSDNAFGPNGVEGIIDLLKSKTCYTLKELRLNNNGLGTTGGKVQLLCIFFFNFLNKVPKSLGISFNKYNYMILECCTCFCNILFSF